MSHTHGTSYGYMKKKCRCTECRSWNAARSRTYYETPSGRANNEKYQRAYRAKKKNLDLHK